MFTVEHNSFKDVWILSYGGYRLITYKGVRPDLVKVEDLSGIDRYLEAKRWNYVIGNDVMRASDPNDSESYFDFVSRKLYPEAVHCCNVGKLSDTINARDPRPHRGCNWKKITSNQWVSGYWSASIVGGAWRYHHFDGEVEVKMTNPTVAQWAAMLETVEAHF